MVDIIEKKGRGRPKKDAAASKNKIIKSIPDEKKYETHVAHLSALSGVPKNVIYEGVLKIEEINSRRKLLALETREVIVGLKKQGIPAGAIHQAVRFRKLPQETLLNLIEDLRIVITACPDMDQLDFFGTHAIQKYVDSQKQNGGTSEVIGNIASLKASAVDPEESANNLANSGAVPATGTVNLPRSVSQILN